MGTRNISTDLFKHTLNARSTPFPRDGPKTPHSNDRSAQFAGNSQARDITLHKTSICGMRPTNEDVEIYNMNMATDGTAINPNLASVDFFCIADGHGGAIVAQFVVPLLQRYLMRKKLVYPLPHAYIAKIYNFIQKRLEDHPHQIARACGCTALVVVRYTDFNGNKNVQVINLGDCRAVLSRKGLAIPLSKDHKPYWSDEKKRIDLVNKKLGTNNRVHFDAGDWRIGDLSVSRSFGDLDNVPYVTHIPDTFHYQLMPDDEFIVLACDGIFDQLQNHEVVNFVRDHLNGNNVNLYDISGRYSSAENANKKNIARKLAEFSIAKGSSDNCSVLIIFFDK